MFKLRERILLASIAMLLVLLAVSGFHPYDQATWVMEVFPIFLALPILCWTYSRFPLSNLLYVLIFTHAVILLVGGHYTYARVPIGFSLADWFGIDRNPYDKIGHFYQGLVPALVAREILLRGAYVRGRKMLAFVVCCIVLAISASYEFIEWGAALAMGQGAEEFLGTQGDPWDTQSDMFFALIGSVSGMLLFSPLQDSQIARIDRGAFKDPV